jgi:hypothetical protein
MENTQNAARSKSNMMEEESSLMDEDLPRKPKSQK